MPLWRIYANPHIFTSEQKQALAQSITKLYLRVGLPAFYVNVLFIDVATENMYTSGQPQDKFVRITVEHIARSMPSPDTAEGAKYRKGFLDRVNDALQEHIIDRKELKWELHVSMTPQDLWRVQGLDPPPANSEAEQMWKTQDAPVPWQSMTV